MGTKLHGVGVFTGLMVSLLRWRYPFDIRVMYLGVLATATLHSQA